MMRTIFVAFFEFQEGCLFFMDVIEGLGKVGDFNTNKAFGNYVLIDLLRFSNEKKTKTIRRNHFHGKTSTRRRQ